MENCLITKLKSTVDNDNLERLNEVRLHFNITSAYQGESNVINVSSETVFSLSDPTKHIYDSSKNPVNVQNWRKNGSVQFYLLDLGEYDLIIKSKYNLTSKMYITSIALSEPIDLKVFKYTSISNLESRSTSSFKFKGDLSALKGKNMTKAMLEGNELYGNFVDVFGEQTSLTSFRFAGNIEGDIVEFVRKQVKAGRESYTFGGTSIPYLGDNTNIKFNGETIRNRQTNVLTWGTNSSDSSKIDISLTTGSDVPMTATVAKLT